MDKFVPFQKQSKKKQKEQNTSKRGSWGVCNPVTRKPANPKAYNRNKAKKWDDTES
ncbi:MAG: hypothetical protein ACOX7K_10380 [Oscillospiraceae bacterium]